MNEPISVTALNQYIKGMFERERLLSRVLVRSEISNYKVYPSGHHYFSLKDAESSIRCVMFRREAMSLRFRPENGMKVVVSGRVSVFPRDGAYQLYCATMVPDGVGELAFAFEQLKNRLHKEGLFDPAHKKPIPAHPRTIALVTSPAGAAVRDMIRILGARYPMAKVLVVPVRVQGEEAPEEIAQGLDLVNALDLADLIITGRGGGSMEDLWAFNDEGVARAIFRSRIPVISAVGHEPDVTIADFVADLRASTPSNAAELAVPDQGDLRDRMAHLQARMDRSMDRRLQTRRDTLHRLGSSPFLQSPQRAIQEKRLLLDYQQQRLLHAMERQVGEHRRQMGRLAASLDALSPFKVLSRGYSITQKDDGTVVSELKQVQKGDTLQVRVSDGTITCTAEGKEKTKWQKRS
ncbi:MAG: exodeoxyribonuclease VII large subunit [Ruminiclostridium sp.]|nr:exodeoxyribonuclease VII large subunit [Ruminiclostridium sp.]MBQ9934141.1 exodeoxyribonuclease VII large subunit [Ruminiclostridium sp.]